MAKQKQPLSFTFINPNDTRSFERQLCRILIDKLAAAYTQQKMARSSP